jgi:hypothetical protein
LFQRSGDGFRRLQVKLIDRGLFLLIVGHLLIAAAFFLSSRTWTGSFSTDAIGAAMVIGAITIPRLGRRSRLIVGALAYAITWIVVYMVVPRDPHIEALRELLFGSAHPTAFSSGSFPIVPWAAIYLASTVLGERVAVLLARGAFRRAALELTAIGSCGIVAVVFIKLAVVWAGVTPLRHVSFALLRVGTKSPPAPLYLLFYGGIGLLLLAGWLVTDFSKSGGVIVRKVAKFGQSSLFVFISHYYVDWLGVQRLPPGPVFFTGIFYFVISTGLILILAREWHRHRCNRFLTVGYEAVYGTGVFRRPALTH